MSKEGELRLSLTFIISFFLHLVIFISLISPRFHELLELEKILRKPAIKRDIIVNINQDNKRVITNKTLLSDKDSSARGFITKKTGDRWLNNSLDFKLLKGNRGKSKGRKIKIEGKKKTILLSDYSEVVVLLEKERSGGDTGEIGIFDKVLIPDKNDVTRMNAIFYSNDGRFSFNTAKFKNFKFFKRMKDKIASNWHPPLMANAVIYGYNPLTGGYAPGRTRIMAILSQEVKTYFVLNRKGDIIKVEILDSYGHRSLDSSCVNAIRFSKNFGKVPDDIKGNFIVIRFIFGYYVY